MISSPIKYPQNETAGRISRLAVFDFARFVLASNSNVAWGPIETGGGKPLPPGEILSISLKRKKKKFLRFFYNFCDCVFETSKKDPFRGGEACSSAIFALLVVS
jgi:hypothetical protein